MGSSKKNCPVCGGEDLTYYGNHVSCEDCIDNEKDLSDALDKAFAELNKRNEDNDGN